MYKLKLTTNEKNSTNKNTYKSKTSFFSSYLLLQTQPFPSLQNLMKNMKDGSFYFAECKFAHSKLGIYTTKFQNFFKMTQASHLQWLASTSKNQHNS